MSETYYLDNNALAYIADRCTHLQRKQLLAQVQNGQIGLFVSLYSIEELVPLYRVNSFQYSRQVEILAAFIGNNIFRICHEIIPLEVQKRRQLTRADALLPTEKIQSTYAAIHDPALLITMASELATEKRSLQRVYRELRDRIEQHLLPEYRDIARSPLARAALLRQDLGIQLVIDRDLMDEWSRSILDACFDGIDVDDLPNINRLPCTRAFVAITLAAIRRRHITDRKQSGSDSFDEIHCAQAAYCDYFVSDDIDIKGRHDADLRGLLNHLSSTTLKVVDFETFIRRTISK